VIFTKADKGKVTVALERQDYISAMEKLLYDKNTYIIIKKNPIIYKNVKRNLNFIIKMWLKNNRKKEYEKNRTLSFLDLSLCMMNDRILIDWFHKKTSRKDLSYFSNHPRCHKTGIIYNLVNRAILLSHPSPQREKFCIKVLLGDPLNLISREINSRLNWILIFVTNAHLLSHNWFQ